jgi:hypothetical protein
MILECDTDGWYMLRGAEYLAVDEPYRLAVEHLGSGTIEYEVQLQ